MRALDANVPILVLTKDDRQETADRFFAAGASDYAVKPIKAPDFLSRVGLNLRYGAELKERAKARTRSVTAKGIVPVTLDCILAFLQEQTDYVSLGDISAGTGLAYQTVSRYLQHLVTEGGVQVQSTYGKVGRPRQKYSLAK